MVKEADAHAGEDHKRREEADARNNADQLVYSTEKTLSEHGDKLPPDEKKNIQKAIERTKKALEGSDVEAIKSASNELMNASHKLAQVMYEQATASQGQEQQSAPGGGAHQGGGASSGGADDVVDAEYHDIDDKK